jgi:hypothetical protein
VHARFCDLHDAQAGLPAGQCVALPGLATNVAMKGILEILVY